jgi:hypothetical protein
VQSLASIGECAAAGSAARVVLECMRQFGAQRSNPVLKVLQETPTFLQHRHYPQPPLEFAAGRGRAYYHSHPLAGADPEEHGHFHLFFRHGDGTGKENWAHLAALAMDRNGQAERWFATNRWVTGGRWGERCWLLAGVDALAPEREAALLPRWLTAMIRLYRSELDTLLRARDAYLTEWRDASSGNEILYDRCLYELAQLPVDLVAKLAAQLTGENP